jgi:hypothetical protein
MGGDDKGSFTWLNIDRQTGSGSQNLSSKATMSASGIKEEASF